MTALTDKLTQLKLDFMAKELDRVLTDAAAKSLSPSAALEWLTDHGTGRPARSFCRATVPIIEVTGTAWHRVFQLQPSQVPATDEKQTPSSARSGFYKARNEHHLDWEPRNGKNFSLKDHRVESLPGQSSGSLYAGHANAQSTGRLPGRSFTGPPTENLYRPDSFGL